MRDDDKPVVVGVDGSAAALNALRWALTEAVFRQAPIRLVHAVPERPSAGRVADCTDAVLLTAEDAISEVGKPVRLELRRTVGEPAEVLIAESCNAAMVCVGEPAPANGKMFGATAVALMEHARCPVAVIRTGADGRPHDDGVISVVLDDQPDNDARVHLAMQEGRLRKAAVRQVDRRVDSWIRRYPDVPVEVVAAGTGRQYRRSAGDGAGVQLAVVGAADAAAAATLTMPNCHPILGYPDCSVLLVRT
jgi:nucleotide-binding universal stress UspA family protein